MVLNMLKFKRDIQWNQQSRYKIYPKNQKADIVHLRQEPLVDSTSWEPNKESPLPTRRSWLLPGDQEKGVSIGLCQSVKKMLSFSLYLHRRV